ncbi:MAG TPA: penicillin acylase family protein [Lapillicoccus sp.]|nr:penicillin acylase family protein [Lapillicoccus sp.]
MARARVARRVGLGVLILVVLLVVGVAVVLTGVVRQSWPQTSGEIKLNGLGGRVEVIRDARGVPQIYADSTDDLFRAQGFVAAQDRFFEMDFRRHVTAGRLSEMVGSAGLSTDRVVRTMGWRAVAEKELALVSPATRQYLNAYADGVNDYIGRADSPSDMGLEYVVLGQQYPGYTVEKWSAVDSLAWLKAMGWDLISNYGDELTRARLGTTLPPDRLAMLFPDYSVAGHPPILGPDEWTPGTAPAASAIRPGLTSGGTTPAAPSPVSLSSVTSAVFASAQAALDSVPALLGRGDGIGSNSWVVAGSHTTTGKPLLANDPHLGTSIPGIWYQTGLHCRTVSAACPFDVSGFTFAGMPGVIVGHNQSIAWGLTNLAPDVSDFYLEKVTDQTYLRDGQQVPLETTTETIKVAGGNDVLLPIRRTTHGPIISDVIDSVGKVGRNALVRLVPQQDTYAVSLSWTGLVPNTTADAIFGIDAAQNFTEFRAAAAKFAVPSQNLVYADTAGHIGYQSPGMIPIRSTSVPNTPPGYWPAPGWDSQYDWKGFVPFEQLPWTYDPPEGYIVTANNQVTAATGPQVPFLTTDWDYGWRSSRIETLVQQTLNQGGKISAERMSEIQNDTYNGFAPTLVQSLLQIDLSGDEFTQQAQTLLGDWDFTQPADKGKSSVRAAYYNAVWMRIVEYTFNDELPQDLQANGGAQYMAAMITLLKDPTNGWWDDRRTPGIVETRDEVLRRALVQARLDLAKHLGKDPVTWSWGELHTLTEEHQVLGGPSVPDVVRKIFNRGPVELGGGSSIVNANGWDVSTGTFDVDWAPSMRMVVDLGNLDASTWVTQTGTSGHPYSAHYVDQLDAWAAGETFAWPFSRGAVEQARQDELILSPQGAASG